MMAKNPQHRNEIEEVALQIWKDFKIQPEKKFIDLRLLETHVASVVSEMMDSQFDLLLQALYRIDVAEDDFKQVLAKVPPDSVALEIARLIINRERMKVHTRQKYR